jgi:glycosyltransferase involved in cell wall biosynthesis
VRARWISPSWGAAASLAPGQPGLVVPYRSPHKLAAAIAELISDPKRLRTMGQRGRHRVEVDFGEDKYLDRHLELIGETG